MILAATLFAVERWRPAVKMAAAAFAVMMMIGSLYFVPLSHARGHFTLGESYAFNYLVHVDLARPGWYLQDPGRGRGSFAHPPERIFVSPRLTPLRSLPARIRLSLIHRTGSRGVRPRFVLRRQMAALLANFANNRELLLALGIATGAILTLGYFSRRKQDIAVFSSNWPMCILGLLVALSMLSCT